MTGNAAENIQTTTIYWKKEWKWTKMKRNETKQRKNEKNENKNKNKKNRWKIKHLYLRLVHAVLNIAQRQTFMKFCRKIKIQCETKKTKTKIILSPQLGLHTNIFQRELWIVLSWEWKEKKKINKNGYDLFFSFLL